MLLAETTGIEADGAVIALQPSHTAERLLGRGKKIESNERSLRLGEHHVGLAEKNERTSGIVLLEREGKRGCTGWHRRESGMTPGREEGRKRPFNEPVKVLKERAGQE